MAKEKAAIDQLQEVGQEITTAESLLVGLREKRDGLLLQAREEDPGVSLQQLANLTGMRREAAHYAVLRARARRGEEVTV